MAAFAAFIDANVFYSMTKTDLVLEFARAGMFRARWSEDVHDEWMRNLAANKGTTREKLEYRRDRMNAAVREPLVTGYQDLIPSLTAINEKDRHVLAAAIIGRCSVIVTSNLKDFPDEALAQYEIEAQHPDTFFLHQFTLADPLSTAAVKAIRARMKSPPFSPDEYIARLKANQLPLLAAEIEARKRLI